MAADPAVGSHRPLQIHTLPLPQRSERRYPRRFRADIRADLAAVRRDHGQADAVDRQAVAGRQIRRERRTDSDTEPARRLLHFGDLADRFNEAGEHTLRSACRDRGPRPSVRSTTTMPDRTPRTIGPLRGQAQPAPRTVGRSQRPLRPRPPRAPRRLPPRECSEWRTPTALASPLASRSLRARRWWHQPLRGRCAPGVFRRAHPDSSVLSPAPPGALKTSARWGAFAVVDRTPHALTGALDISPVP